MRQPRRVLALVLLAVLLGACAGIPQLASAPAAPAPVPAPGRAAFEGEPGAPAGTDAASGIFSQLFQAERVLILTAEVQLEAQDPWQVADRVRLIAAGMGGDALPGSLSVSGGQRYAMLVLRVPNERFEEALSALRRIEGVELLSSSSRAEDRTQEFIDLDARLAAKQAEEQRYLALLPRAERIEDILRIEQALSNVRTQIEQLQGQLNYLRNRSQMATITVHIQPSAALPPPDGPAWDPAKTFAAAIAALGSVLRAVGDLFIWALVFGWIPLVALGMLAALLRWRPGTAGQ